MAAGDQNYIVRNYWETDWINIMNISCLFLLRFVWDLYGPSIIRINPESMSLGFAVVILI